MGVWHGNVIWTALCSVILRHHNWVSSLSGELAQCTKLLLPNVVGCEGSMIVTDIMAHQNLAGNYTCYVRWNYVVIVLNLLSQSDIMQH